MIPKIISGILAAILIAVVLYALLPSVWFWIGFEVLAALLVAIGCAGEWYLHHHPAGKKKVEKEEHHKLESRFIAAVVIGVFMEFFSLAHAIPESIKLEREVAFANERTATTEARVLELKTNLADLNKATLELAHQYDLSTNALAEANARLKNIKTPKEQFLDCLGSLSDKIISGLEDSLAERKLEYVYRGFASEYVMDQLRDFSRDPVLSKYFTFSGTGNLITESFPQKVGFVMETGDNITLEINPAIIQLK